jgi:hypothetical protein
MQAADDLARLLTHLCSTDELMSVTPDLEAYLVASDLYEEAGDAAMAAGCRACTRLRCRPYRFDRGEWSWIRAVRSLTDHEETFRVPDAVYRRLTGVEDVIGYRDYVTWREAVADLGRAYTEACDAGG